MMGRVTEAEMEIRGAHLALRMELEEMLLAVDVCDLQTAEQWRGEFDPAYIEDLTRKTGNFKQFSIFCNMLQSAVSQTSEAVTLDLLTFSDLEHLRRQKAGLMGRPRPQPQSPAVTSKRYLILVYTVEFDRIHYPLPLPYQGKPDPAALQREIRALKAELASFGRDWGDHGRMHTDTRRLHAELAQVHEEKESLARALDELQVGGHSPSEGTRGLREVVRTLEEQLLRERAKNQRSANKRSQEHRVMLEQLEELKASERALKIRVKNLTNELAILRRGRASPVPYSGFKADEERRRSGSRDRCVTHQGTRARSGSRDSGCNSRIPRTSQSPSGGHRFDPTGYIQERQRRQKEADLRNKRKVRRDMLITPPTSAERGRSRSRDIPLIGTRSSSVESRHSCHSAHKADLEEAPKPPPHRSNKPSYKTSVAVTMRPGAHFGKKPFCSTPSQKRRGTNRTLESWRENAVDLSEIDARLQALQDYMRDLDPGH